MTWMGLWPRAKTSRQGRSSVGFSASLPVKLSRRLFRESVDDAADAGPVDGAGAHGAGLGAGVEGAFGEDFVAEELGGLGAGEAFGVLGGFAFGADGVVARGDEDLAVFVDDEAAEGMGAVGAGSSGRGRWPGGERLGHDRRWSCWTWLEVYRAARPQLLRTPGFVGGVAELFEGAGGAFGFAGFADLAAVVDEFVGELDPAVVGDDFHQVLFDGLRRFRCG